MPALLLVDDHPLVHVAIEAALLNAESLWRVHSATDELEALQCLQQQVFDVVMLDIGLPQVDGLQLLRKIRRHYPSLPIIIYTAQEEEAYAKMAHSAGANGFINKGTQMADVVRRLELVLHGENTFPDTLLAPRIPAPRAETLTPKEMQILGLLAKGHSNLAIAGMLNISNKTVSTHKKNILNKTGAENLLSLIAVFKELSP